MVVDRVKQGFSKKYSVPVSLCPHQISHGLLFGVVGVGIALRPDPSTNLLKYGTAMFHLLHFIQRPFVGRIN